MINISGTTKIVGVWGHPVGHSRSPVMHNAALRELGIDWVYVPFDVDPAPVNVAQAISGIRALGIIGVNVTVPLKELVLPYVGMTKEALQIRSVNTIYNQGGVLYGDSTDGRGFLRALEEVGQAAERRQVLILGAGGSARAVVFALAARGNHCLISNRTPERSDGLAADINRVYPGMASAAGWGAETEPCDLIVNTTSLGMNPAPEEMPALPPNVFANRPFVCDLIYAPRQTKLLALAEAAGCATTNGVKMLVHQGAGSLALWTGRDVSEMPVAAMEQAVLGSL